MIVTDISSLPALMTVKEYAALMRLDPAAVYQRLARSQVRGAFKLGRSWRIRKDVTVREITRGSQ